MKISKISVLMRGQIQNLNLNTAIIKERSSCSFKLIFTQQHSSSRTIAKRYKYPRKYHITHRIHSESPKEAALIVSIESVSRYFICLPHPHSSLTSAVTQKHFSFSVTQFAAEHESVLIFHDHSCPKTNAS